jgi:hypothetical protein
VHCIVEVTKMTSGRIQPLYAVPIQHACQSRDLDEMKALAARAEEYLAAEGDIAAELAALKAAIAEVEAQDQG